MRLARKLLPLLPALAMIALSAGLALASGGGGVSDHQMWDFIYRIMNFAVLVAVLVVVLRKPLKSGLSSRVDQIKSELEELEAKREEARRAYALMEQRLADAAGEHEKILAEFRAMGEKEKAAIISGAETTAQRIKEQASFTIEQETAQAKAELRRDVAEMSAALAEDLLKEKINSEDQTRLVDEYLAKVSQEVQ
ncbi:MAG: F0F1 ATP synthase subunit B [Desulfarculaceae bacterium]|nr:F0F1 ATP synthase subunit B [Desulfarculaceae bacterium]MCF8047818.1 F0F1 ATP synthase subunit B [Desulfarculaceae bacterium]MCF8066097.1 F0F1 ATP synthase subunit B [Desulfarculaceae bacterium]MCF8096878.1 F0F1 ATP synthase subunit B [Desulfarculaceae bacterium]MCF8121677.1 F0F1 ATP synthase subunit B [Desulfarculaceae bacterium]